MAEYIEREKIALTDFEIAICKGNYKELCKMIIDKIGSTPAADVRPVVRGKWENVEPNFMAKCSNCHRYYISRDEKYEFHFCPNCGAVMEE